MSRQPGSQPGPIPPSGGPAKLTVQPENVLQLKRDLEEVRDEVQEFLRTRGQDLRVGPMAADPVSFEAAEALTQNADSALEAAQGYVDRLIGVIDALDQSAKTYQLVEDTNTDTFRQRG